MSLNAFKGIGFGQHHMLTETNYNSWARTTKALLKFNGLAKYVLGENSIYNYQPDGTTTQPNNREITKLEEASALIEFTIGDKYGHLVDDFQADGDR